MSEIFNEVHIDSIKDKNSGEYTDILLAFLKSSNIQAYPCGRRRSVAIQNDVNNNGTYEDSENYRIPFDPEARLNTEANNRKHSGLNGYTQTYYKGWDKDSKSVVLSLLGYLFTAALNVDYDNEAAFAAAFGTTIIEVLAGRIEKLRDSAANLLDEEKTTVLSKAETLEAKKDSATNIYANILLEEVPLYVGALPYFTTVLRNQVGDFSEIDLDRLNSEAANTSSVEDKINPNNFYFSGLSFSTEPLTGTVDEMIVPNIVDRNGQTIKQTIISLCLFKKDAGVWKVSEAARLPDIKHGDAENSIVVGDVTANDITANDLSANNITGKNIITETVSAEQVLTDADGNELNNIKANKAQIKTLTAPTIQNVNLESYQISGKQILSPEFLQEINKVNYSVPAISLGPEENGYRQLQILRVNKVD